MREEVMNNSDLIESLENNQDLVWRQYGASIARRPIGEWADALTKVPKMYVQYIRQQLIRSRGYKMT